ncbi:MAG: hypothetical protein ABL888_21550, partial [Pirellulaceae bacterium]
MSVVGLAGVGVGLFAGGVLVGVVLAPPGAEDIYSTVSTPWPGEFRVTTTPPFFSGEDASMNSFDAADCAETNPALNKNETHTATE